MANEDRGVEHAEVLQNIEAGTPVQLSSKGGVIPFLPSLPPSDDRRVGHVHNMADVIVATGNLLRARAVELAPIVPVLGSCLFGTIDENGAVFYAYGTLAEQHATAEKLRVALGIDEWANRDTVHSGGVYYSSDVTHSQFGDLALELLVPVPITISGEKPQEK